MKDAFRQVSAIPSCSSVWNRATFFRRWSLAAPKSRAVTSTLSLTRLLNCESAAKYGSLVPQMEPCMEPCCYPRFKCLSSPHGSLVSLEQCQALGSCLVVTVLDHDTLRTDDFEGEAFLSLKAIPGVAGGKEADGFSRQPDAIPAQIRLPLMHPKPNGTTRRQQPSGLINITRGSLDLKALKVCKI